MAPARVLQVNPARPDPEVIQAAAALLGGGGVAVFPTDTVYGIGGDGRRKDTLDRIYAIKRRSPGKPLVRLISRPDEARSWLPRPGHRRLAEAFWPGPLTLIVRLPGGVSRGLRCPGLPFLRRLIEQAGIELAATSANLSGRPEVVSGAEAVSLFRGKVDLILQGGRTSGRASTVLDLTSSPEKILRPGPVTRAEIEKCLGYPID